MRIGLAFDLKEANTAVQGGPEDALEEYDSRETIDIITRALQAGGHTMVPLGGGAAFLDSVRRQPVDIVFNIAEGRGTYRSREAQVPSVLEMLDIPYTGSDPECLAICLDKDTTKRLAIEAGIRTPKWLTIGSGEDIRRAPWRSFPYPAIIKPAYEGSSKGIRLTSLAQTATEAQQKAQAVLKSYRQPVMVEEYIAGDEVTTGIIGAAPRVLGIMRILPRQKDKPFIYSLEVKRDYVNLVDYECPAAFPEKVTAELERASLAVFRTLGCRDFARVDFRVSPEGKAYFLEINPLPGLGSYSDLVIMAVKLGWTHEALIGAVLDAARERYPECVSA